jgi:hypothetical protein
MEQSLLKGSEIRYPSLDQDLDLAAAVLNPARQAQTLGETVNERAKTYPLHAAADA